jgi:Rrf2 family nitric oxide-sensitive transcriptional repressor
MQLTLQSDYAFRVLMSLAVSSPRLSTIQEIAERYQISRGHLMVVVNRLSNLGFIEAIRGRSGGIRLAKPAEEINLADVVVAMEPHFQIVECFQPDGGHCLVAGGCRLRSVFEEALDAWLSVMRSYTLADLVRRNTKLTRLLTPTDFGQPSPARHAH